MKKLTKTERVEKYLNQLMKGRYFKIEDLLELTAGKLQENTPLLDISRSTISAVLTTYKEQYNPKKQKPGSPKKKAPVHQPNQQSDQLLASEVVAVREMITWFKGRLKNELVDFEDLKDALTDIGMDYRKVLKQYRNN